MLIHVIVSYFGKFEYYGDVHTVKKIVNGQWPMAKMANVPPITVELWTKNATVLCEK